MRTIPILFVQLCFAFGLASFPNATIAEPPLRRWTSADGKYTVEAQLLRSDKENVQLRRFDGRPLLVPLAALSEADLRYIQQGQLRRVERLDLGLVAIAQSESRMFLSWRFLGKDPE